MDQKPRRRGKAKTTQSSFDKFYFEYCERAVGTAGQTKYSYVYVGVLYNLYMLTTDDKALLSIKDFCDAIVKQKHSLYKKPKGHLCVKRLSVKEEHKDLLAKAIKASNTYEKGQGREYDYGRAFNPRKRKTIKPSEIKKAKKAK